MFIAIAVKTSKFRTTSKYVTPICYCQAVQSSRSSYPEREWLPSWTMWGLYWARMVTVSHCCPITSRACCSFALRRLIPLNWKQRYILETHTNNEPVGRSWSAVGAVPQGVGHRTLNGLDEQCCLLSLWIQIPLHSLRWQWRSLMVLLLSVLSHCVVPPSMAFRILKKKHFVMFIYLC